MNPETYINEYFKYLKDEFLFLVNYYNEFYDNNKENWL